MATLDLALVLAIDVSASVDFDEFQLMVGGLGLALRDPAVQAAALGGTHGAVALAALFWSDAQEVAVPWRRLESPADCAAFAEALENAPRLPRPGATGLGEALVASLALLARAPAEAARQVVDVSGDGRANAGRAPGPVRDLAVAAGVTINGLAVLNEEPELLDHYAAEVIGGPGAFAMACADYLDFAEAMRRKLVREFRGPEALIVRR
jgi:hypothetical protein